VSLNFLRAFHSHLQLLIALGNYLILPLGLVYGRRPAAIISIVVLLVATVGCAVSQTFEQHLGLRILQGLATGATESVRVPSSLTVECCIN
jgi:MFS family permease